MEEPQGTLSSSEQLELELHLEAATSAAPVKGSPLRRSKRWLWALPLVLLPLGAIAWQVGMPSMGETQAPQGEAVERNALPVSVVTVESQSGFGVKREYAGELVARRQSQLGFEGAGTGIAVTVDQGMGFGRGR
ncbi:MAG: hypothetical protein AAGF75_03545 [Cyanobacteria bacterium P01_H01_bin.130]